MDKTPWEDNSIWGLPSSDKKKKISFRMIRSACSCLKMAISILSLTKSHRSWSQLYYRSILSFSLELASPVPAHFLSRASNTASWCLSHQQINNYLIPLTSICFHFLFNVASIWIRLIFTLFIVEYLYPTTLLFPLEFPVPRTVGFFFFLPLWADTASFHYTSQYHAPGQFVLRMKMIHTALDPL